MSSTLSDIFNLSMNVSAIQLDFNLNGLDVTNSFKSCSETSKRDLHMVAAERDEALLAGAQIDKSV